MGLRLVLGRCDGSGLGDFVRVRCTESNGWSIALLVLGIREGEEWFSDWIVGWSVALYIYD